MLRFVRGQAYRAKTQRCAKVIAFQMPALRDIHGNLLRAKEGHCGSIYKAEGQVKSSRSAGRVKGKVVENGVFGGGRERSWGGVLVLRSGRLQKAGPTTATAGVA